MAGRDHLLLPSPAVVAVERLLEGFGSVTFDRIEHFIRFGQDLVRRRLDLARFQVQKVIEVIRGVFESLGDINEVHLELAHVLKI